MAPPSVLIHALLYHTISTLAPNALGLCLPGIFYWFRRCFLIGRPEWSRHRARWQTVCLAPTHTDQTRSWGLLLFILLAYSGPALLICTIGLVRFSALVINSVRLENTLGLCSDRVHNVIGDTEYKTTDKTSIKDVVLTAAQLITTKSIMKIGQQMEMNEGRHKWLS